MINSHLKPYNGWVFGNIVREQINVILIFISYIVYFVSSYFTSWNSFILI